MKKKAAGTGRRRMRVVAVAVEIGRRRMHVVVVAIGTGTGERRRSYGHCSFIYIIRVKDIFVITSYAFGAPAKMMGAPSNSQIQIQMSLSIIDKFIITLGVTRCTQYFIILPILPLTQS